MRIAVIAILLIVVSSCKVGPRDILYGEDACHYCKMTVVSHQHAAEAVTDKGKIYMFDAIECLVNFQEDNPDQLFSYLLVTDYSSPGKLTDAESATYLISQGLPSPMGAYLSAFEEKKAAEEVQAEKKGVLYNWKSLKEKFRQDKQLLN